MGGKARGEGTGGLGCTRGLGQNWGSGLGGLKEGWIQGRRLREGKPGLCQRLGFRFAGRKARAGASGVGDGAVVGAGPAVGHRG